MSYDIEFCTCGAIAIPGKELCYECKRNDEEEIGDILDEGGEKNE